MPSPCLPHSRKYRPQPHRIVARTYDNDFRVSSWSVNGGTAIAQTYDADGALTKAGDLTLAYNASTGFLTGASLGVTSDAYQYSTYGEIAAYAATAASQEVYKVSYTHDSLGRIESENEVVEGVSTQWAYRYDSAGRLIEVLKDGASWSVYRYDSNGNRIEAATQSGLVNGTYDAQDRLLSYGQYAYEYTANGELKTKTDTSTGAVTRYAYDVFGNLTRVDLPDGRVIEYGIDGANRRVGKKINGVLVKGWLYKDSLKPIAELDAAGNVVATFVYGSKYNVPDYVVKAGVSYRVFSDQLGTPRLVVNSGSGAITARIEYDEFGNVLTDTNVGFIPFGFAGGLYDDDTGLVRFGARDYDPSTGRWTSKDPIRFDGEDGDNLYGYVLANPLNHVDIEGKGICGPQNNPLLEALIPDYFFFWNGGCTFTWACETHDKCYCDCVTAKEMCDYQFFLRLMVSSNGHPGCMLAAVVYTFAVEKYGGEHYRKGCK